MLKRIGISGVGAAVMTLGLGFGMMAMIAVEFQAEEKYASATFDVNSVPEDIPPPKPRQEMTELVRVETPPPPPVIERVDSRQPSEPIAERPRRLVSPIPL